MSITKTTSTHPEQQLPPSPAKPYSRAPASGSYSARDGRANVFSEVARDRQIPSAGRHTTGDNLKRPTRPGRW
jgi:hypothetical protein